MKLKMDSCIFTINSAFHFKSTFFIPSKFKVNLLHSDDEAASGEVGEEPYKLRLGMIPTDKEMKELKEHIREMKVS